MKKNDKQSYEVVITLSAPGSETAEVTLSLSPPDAVQVDQERVKPLRDCTLAELSAFAAELEAEVWRQHAEKRLEELALIDEARVKITITQKSRPATPDLETVLSQILVLPDNGMPPGGETPDEDGGTAERTESPPAQDVEPHAAEQPAPGATTAGTPAVAAPPLADAPTAADAPTVSDEAPDAAPPAAGAEEQPSALRIAGRRRPLGHPTAALVDILVNEGALREMQGHALSSLDREVAGMLVGPRPEQKEDGRWIVHVTDRVEAKHTQMRGASVTYTPESWRYVHDVLRERYPNEEAVIVGWYHTHPGFGIFLSGMDLFIHTNFFNQPWHIAYVLDPRAKSSGFFCWDRQQKRVQPYDFPWPEWAPNSW
jgi:proteasome lid subunit RPN8/RPN11